ncbi:DNA polymerase V subunit UmuC [Pseudomonas aeruginosa]|nr:DNA polymerase V subunit UmuC [Pseudomonas aeruginosa]
MTILEEMAPAVEVYSIDECFAELTGIPGDLVRLGREMRARGLRCTGIPVGVGIATSKTLAKLANHGAKKWQGQTGGVLDVRDPARRDRLLKACDVWGVGRRMTEHLNAQGIKTAWDLAQSDAWTLRKQFNVVIGKTARELRGVACLEAEEAAPPKQEICCSRMFGKRLHELPPIREAVATYAARACEKLRAQGSYCKRVQVNIRTGMFNPAEPRFSKGVSVELPYPTDDTRLIIKAATDGLQQAYREGFAFSKAEVLLLDLRQPGEFTGDLFAAVQSERATKAMAVMDSINAKWGRGTVRPGGVPSGPDWGMRWELMSQSYTTSLQQLWSVLNSR